MLTTESVKRTCSAMHAKRDSGTMKLLSLGSSLACSKQSISQPAAACRLLLAPLAVLLVVSACWWPEELSTAFLRYQWPLIHTGSRVQQEDELGRALRSTSMADKTLIIGVLNQAYIAEGGMLDIFLRSLREGEGTDVLIKHFLFVAADGPSFRRCRALGLNCYQLSPPSSSNASSTATNQTVDFSREQLFNSDGFMSMMWARTAFLRDVVKRGYSFIFTDMDVLWLRNPLKKLNDYDGRGASGSGEVDDLMLSCDKYKGQPYNESNNINTGFYFMRSNNRTVALLERWYAMRNARMNDQLGLIILRRQGVFRELGMRVRYLETLYFGGFCEHARNMTHVLTIHSNCCRSVEAKLADLTAVWEAWKGSNRTAEEWPRRHDACYESWRKNITVT